MKNRSLLWQTTSLTIMTLVTLTSSTTFGKNIQIKNEFKTVALIADFNGDKQKDTAVLLELGKNSSPLKGCTVSDPWYGNVIKQCGEPLAIGIITSNTVSKKASLTIMHDSSFFSTPIWSANKLPIELILKGSPQFKRWKESVPDLRNDAIALGTEAGIDILIYWNGKEYILFQPNEEP